MDDDDATIVVEHRFTWHALLKSNENPYVKMMIFGCEPAGRQNVGTARWLFGRGHFFQSNENPYWFFTKMHVQQQYRSEVFNRSDVKMYSATHARSEFPLSSELRSKESESIKKAIFHSGGKVAIAECVRILMREWEFWPGTRWRRWDRWMKKLMSKWASQTTPFENIYNSPRQTMNLKLRH